MPVNDWHSFDWTKALRNVDAVYHLAARVHEMSTSDDLESYRRANRDVTIQLATAAANAGVRQFVFMSTAKVAGERTSLRPLREDDPPQPQGAYATSKWEAEQQLNELATRSEMVITSVRPPLIYGAGVRANFLMLMRAIDRRWPLPLGSVTARRSLIYVENVVDALIACTRFDDSVGGTFFISDGEDVAIADLVRRLARALGRRPILFPVPPALLRTMAIIAGRRAVGERLTEPFCIDSTRFQQMARWQPAYSLDDGLAKTAQWYRQLRGGHAALS